MYMSKVFLFTHSRLVKWRWRDVQYDIDLKTFFDRLILHFVIICPFVIILLCSIKSLDASCILWRTIARPISGELSVIKRINSMYFMRLSLFISASNSGIFVQPFWTRRCKLLYPTISLHIKNERHVSIFDSPQDQAEVVSITFKLYNNGRSKMETDESNARYVQ